jgi:hypothetical protein
VSNRQEVQGLLALFVVGLIHDFLRLLRAEFAVSSQYAEQVSDDSLSCRHLGQKAELNGGGLPPTCHGDQRIAAPFPQRFLLGIRDCLQALKGRFINSHGDMPSAI